MLWRFKKLNSQLERFETQENDQMKYSSLLKAEVFLEANKGVKTVSKISQQYELHPVRVTKWKKELLHISIVSYGE